MDIHQFIAFNCASQTFHFLQMERLWQPCMKQAYQCHFPNDICSPCVSGVHFGNPPRTRSGSWRWLSCCNLMIKLYLQEMRCNFLLMNKVSGFLSGNLLLVKILWNWNDDKGFIIWPKLSRQSSSGAWENSHFKKALLWAKFYQIVLCDRMSPFCKASADIRGKWEGDWPLRRTSVLPFWWGLSYTPPMKNFLRGWLILACSWVLWS